MHKKVRLVFLLTGKVARNLGESEERISVGGERCGTPS